jgi:hypothetical protein
LALRENKTTKFTFDKEKETKEIATSMWRKDDKKWSSNNQLIQKNCASLKKGRKKITLTYKTTPTLGRPIKKACKHKRKPKRYVQINHILFSFVVRIKTIILCVVGIMMICALFVNWEAIMWLQYGRNKPYKK